MRLTTKTNLAMRVLMVCGSNPGRLIRKAEIAASCNASENHLAQVIHELGVKGFLSTQRGRSGGMMLARPMAEISVGHVFRALESDVPFVECFVGGDDGCPLRSVCKLRCVITGALNQFYETLDQTTLADLVEENMPLKTMLRVA